MPGSLRLTRLRAAGASFIAALALIPVLLSGGTAHAASFQEILAIGNAVIASPGSTRRSPAVSLCRHLCRRGFPAVHAEVLNGTYVELRNYYGLCITFDIMNGSPDGAYALLGNCVGAQNQIFEAEPGYRGSTAWYMPDRVDNLGRHVALDNEGGNFVVNNHIDESYYSSGLLSEGWTFTT